MTKSTELTPAQNMEVVRAITALGIAGASEDRLAEARKNMVREIRKVNRATSAAGLAKLNTTV